METGRIGASPRRHGGFTLVELLVVIAIIGILVALLLPAIQAAREAARRSQCSNNLKQIGIAILNYENTKKRMPAGSTTKTASNVNGMYMTTWTIDILPTMEDQAIYDSWNAKRTIPLTDAAHKDTVQQRIISSYLCPSDQGNTELVIPESEPPLNTSTWAPGSYRANSGAATKSLNKFWDAPAEVAALLADPVTKKSRGPIHAISLDGTLKPVKIGQISDGTSKTRMVGEWATINHPTRRTLWSYPYTSYNQSTALDDSLNLLADYDKCIALTGNLHNCKRSWGSLHAAGVINNAFCDGSVRAISPEVDLALWTAASTIGNNESVESL